MRINEFNMLAARIAANMKAVRLAKGLSLEKVAARCDPPTSYQQLQKLEKATRPITTDWIERIAGALGVDPMELVTGHGMPPEAGLTQQVADELGRVLGKLALGGQEPSPDITQVLGLALQEITTTFLAHPEAYRDLAIARPVVEMATRQAARAAH